MPHFETAPHALILVSRGVHYFHVTNQLANTLTVFMFLSCLINNYHSICNYANLFVHATVTMAVS